MTQTASSPCRKRCRLDTTDSYCTGCGRTLHELRTWRNLSEVEKKDLMVEIIARQPTLAEFDT